MNSFMAIAKVLMGSGRRFKSRDAITHTIATILAAYPFTPTEHLVQEFGLTRETIHGIATIAGVTKSKTAVKEASEYLKIQGRKIDERRGGHNKVAIEKISRNGRVIATYSCLDEAAIANGISKNRVYFRCADKVEKESKYINGYTFRYKKNGN